MSAAGRGRRECAMTTLQVGLLYGGTTFLLLFSGMPIAFAVGAVALAFMFAFMPAANVAVVAETIYSELDNFTLLTIPLFVLMGAAIGKSRAGEDLYSSLNRWLSRVPGGLGVANVLACSVFAAMCGSSPATCSAIGSSGIPQMRARGYSEELATGLIAAGGTLGILIPPSLTLILYGLAAEQSIGRLFMAGVGPGLVLTAMFIAWTIFQFRRDRLRATAAAAAGGPALQVLEHYTWAQRLETLPRFVPFLLVIALIMVALYGGWATPSEVAGIGAAAALLMVVLIYRCYRWDDLRLILGGTVRESCMVMLIIAMSFLYTYVMSYLHITQSTAEWLIALPLSKWAFFFWVNVLLIVLGFFLPPVAIILMVTPILLPALKAHGFDLIWFGVIMTILMEMGLIHPPVGLNLFVINGIAPDIPLRKIVWGVLPFLDRCWRSRSCCSASFPTSRSGCRTTIRGNSRLRDGGFPISHTRAICSARSARRASASAMHSASAVGPAGSAKQPAKTRPSSGNAAESHRARQQRDRHARRPRVLRDDEGRLAQQRLRVGPAFAGDRPIGRGKSGVEPDQRRDHFGAGAELRAEQLEREAESARCARAGTGRGAAAGGCFRQRGPMPERRIEGGDFIGFDPLLRAEDRGRAELATERIVDVGHDRDRAFREQRIEAARRRPARARRGRAASARSRSRRLPAAKSRAPPAFPRRRRWCCCRRRRS